MVTILLIRVNLWPLSGIAAMSNLSTIAGIMRTQTNLLVLRIMTSRTRLAYGGIGLPGSEEVEGTTGIPKEG